MPFNIDLLDQCRLLKIKLPISEFRFNPPRKWRIDFCWPDEKIAVEIEGGIFSRGRHVRGLGFLKDLEKYNTITLMGYRLFRFTPQQVKNGEAIGLIRELIKRKL